MARAATRQQSSNRRASQASSKRQTSQASSRPLASQGGSHQRVSQSSAMSLTSVPARFMAPRLTLIVAVIAMCALGLVMVYSASSVSALKSGYSPSYYAVRQAIYIAVGTVGALFAAKTDYHTWLRSFLGILWGAILILLIITLGMGMVNHGAQRWINIGAISIQPSEFAKIALVLTTAHIADAFFVKQELTRQQAGVLSLIGVGLPLLLILIQPDKGTVFIIGTSLLVMLILAGVPAVLIGAVALVGAVTLVVLIQQDSYATLRLIVWNPTSDRYGAGYQIIQGLYAFAKGGITGVGIGFSQQKYSYIPEAHNDYIFAIIGEELGLIGCAAVLCGFAAFVYAGVQIARHAPDMSGTLIVSGFTVMIAIQALVNVGGVTGMIPVSGKTLPFISYGGSSIITCLVAVGLMVSVSKQSALPETEYERQRGRLSVLSTSSAARSSTSSGATRPSASSSSMRPSNTSNTSQLSSGSGLRLLEGGSSHPSKRTSQTKRQRINLGPSPAERLRSRDSSSRRR